MIWLTGALGALLRVLYFATDRSLWSGEWSSIEFSSGSPAGIARALADDVHPPLYFLTLHLFEKVFGSFDWVYRLPSLIAGLAALAAVYLLARELFDRRIARRGLLLLALSPYAIHQSVEIRGHGWLIALCSLGTWCWLKLRRQPSAGFGLGFLACAGAALYTVHFAWFWLAAITLWQAMNPRKSGLWLAGALAAGSPALALLVRQSLMHGEWTGGWADLGMNAGSWLAAVGAVFWHPIAGPYFDIRSGERLTVFASSSIFFWVTLIVALWAWACAAGLWSKLRQKNPPRAALFFALIVLPVLTVGFINPTRLDTRYFGFALPFTLILLSAGLERHRPLMRAVFIGAYAAVSLGSFIWMCRLETDPYFRENDRAMMAYALTNAGPRDAVNDSQMLRYYMRTRGWTSRAAFVDDGFPEGAGEVFEKVWLLDGQPFDSHAFAPFIEQMRLAGYEPDGSELVFGSPESRAILNLFKRSSQP